jgi:putative ABC transport system permease protein
MNFRVAFRSLTKSPGFAITAIVTLTLGIGAVSAIFSVVNSVLLKPLAGVETDRLVRVFEGLPNGAKMARVRTYREWQKLTEVFEAIGARQSCNPNITGSGEPQQLRSPCVTSSWFTVQRAQPLLGRTFLNDEDQPGRANVTVLDHAFWLERFGADAGVIGRTIVLDRKPYTVVGVMPADFQPYGKHSADVYLPWVLDENASTSVEVTARLRPGVSIENVHAALDVVHARLKQEVPFEYKDVKAPERVEPLIESVVGGQRTLLSLLLGASALVLLVACANAANLFLARAAAKKRESAIRAFLGANRRQLIAPALAESTIVATFGGGFGLLAAWGIALTLAARLTNLPRAEEITVDGRVVLATLAISIATVFACGVAPALWKRRARSGALVVAEVALTFGLLISSGLLIRSFVAMRHVDLGYRPEGVALGFVSQPEDPSDQRTKAITLWRRVRERIAALPEVASVATATSTPGGGMNFGLPLIREGEGLDKAATSGASAVVVSADYFQTVGIALRGGRTFNDQDSPNGAGVVIVSQSIADKYFDGHALGKRIRLPIFSFNVTKFGDVTLREIVGVVADVRQSSIGEVGRMTMYLPESQNAVRFTHVLVRSSTGNELRLERAIRHAIFEEAPDLAMAPMLSLESATAYLTRTASQAMWLLGAFAGLALLLACVGVHGVVAYATAQREREMGIRMALGARPAQLFGLVTRQALRLAMIGAALGIAGAYASTRWLESLLFGVGRADFVTYAAGVAVLIAVAAIASFTPALRAAHTDPSVTLRAE